jgi:hypothetical protein
LEFSAGEVANVLVQEGKDFSFLVALDEVVVLVGDVHNQVVVGQGAETDGADISQRSSSRQFVHNLPILCGTSNDVRGLVGHDKVSSLRLVSAIQLDDLVGKHHWLLLCSGEGEEEALDD